MNFSPENIRSHLYEYHRHLTRKKMKIMGEREKKIKDVNFRKASYIIQPSSFSRQNSIWFRSFRFLSRAFVRTAFLIIRIRAKTMGDVLANTKSGCNECCCDKSPPKQPPFFSHRNHERLTRKVGI